MTLLWIDGEPFVYDETVGGIQWVGGVPIFLPQEEQAPAPTGNLIPWTLQAKLRVPASVGVAIAIPDSVVGEAAQVEPKTSKAMDVDSLVPTVKTTEHPY